MRKIEIIFIIYVSNNQLIKYQKTHFLSAENIIFISSCTISGE